MNKPLRRPLNVSLDPALVKEARDLHLNVSRACEAGLDSAVRQARRAAWLQENAAAIAEMNAWVAENDLPLAKHRLF